jgi:hypothetical protein
MDTETQYKKDKIKREGADLDKQMASEVSDATKKAENVMEKRNALLAKAFQENPTYLNFMRNFLRAGWVWGDKNQLDFWEVGLDPTESSLTVNGKNAILSFRHSTKNPNPLTGERRTEGGLIVKGV